MFNIFFVLSLITLILTAVGFILSLVLHSLLNLIFWMKEFLYILGGAVLMMLIQVTATQPSLFTTSIGENIYYSVVLLSGLIMARGYISITTIWREKAYSKVINVITLGLSIVTVIVIVLRWFDIQSEIFYITYSFFVIIPSLIVILNYRTVSRKEYGKDLNLLVIVSLIGYSFEYFEYLMIRNYPYMGTLPLGFMTFTFFSLIISIMSLYFSIKILGQLRGQLSSGTPSEDQIINFCKDNELTSRESQIVGKLLLRFTHREIASQLNISPRTVERHVYNIYQKTGLSSRFELYDIIRVI